MSSKLTGRVRSRQSLLRSDCFLRFWLKRYLAISKLSLSLFTALFLCSFHRERFVSARTILSTPVNVCRTKAAWHTAISVYAVGAGQIWCES